jgi:hypothetical protein
MRTNKYTKKTPRQIYIERLLEEEKSFLYRYSLDKTNISQQINDEIEKGGDSDIGVVYTEPNETNFIINLWNFSHQSGTIINNVNLSFDPSTTVQINWGDGSIETISSDTNYNHTLN